MAASMCREMAAISNCRYVIFSLLLLLAVFSYTWCAKLSDPKILLPYHSSVVTNFTLHINLSKEESNVHDSCYTWRSSHQEVASIKLINSTDGECAFAAEISAVSKSKNRKTSIVLVENKATREILRCIVIVESIARFEIETTTRLLYLEDSPEALMIRGYDNEGNVFSSLAGLEFVWSLQSDKTEKDEIIDAKNILRILRFSESQYTTPFYIETLEDRGLQGDMILVEGIRTGSAKVLARIRDPVYRDVSTSSVVIMVVANLMISPTEAYVLKHATVKYKVELIKQNSIIEIKMPSSQFSLKMQDDSIGELDMSTSIATAKELGSTEVILMDKNIEMKDKDILRPTALLHVVSPSYLAFVVLPDRKWVLQTKREYDIILEVYDKNSHKIFPSDNVILKSYFPEEYFEVLFSSKNGTYHRVQPRKKGITDIEGSLIGVIKNDGTEILITPVLKQPQTVEIYDPIVVEPSLLFFPWDPVSQMSHQYKLTATGGSGEYLWTTSNTHIVNVIKGEITTKTIGTVNITAADRKNQLHTGVSTVHVLPPSDMKFKPTRVEATVGTELHVPLDVFAMYKGKKHAFNDCRKMSLNVSFTDNSIFKYVGGALLLAEGCRILRFKAIQQGHTEVTASYIAGDIELESTVTIAAYDPLEPVDPERETVIAVGSAKEVVFRGGPQPWVLDSTKYYQDLSGNSPAVINLNHIRTFGSARGQHMFLVTCKDFGEQLLTLKVGNDRTSTNQYPAKEETSIRFSCSAPVELHLQPLMTFRRNIPPCPVTGDKAQPIPVHCTRDLDILVTVTDKEGRKFDNISSLEFDWSVSDQSLGSLSDTSSVFSEVVLSNEGIKLVKNFQTLRPHRKPGEMYITAIISAYNSKHLKEAESQISAKIWPKISKSLALQLVEEAVVNPDTISVFNHPSNKVSVDIEKGSGYFFVDSAKSGILKIDYREKKRQIQLVPVSDGSLTVTVYDLCVDVLEPPTATIYVSGVGSIELSVMDKVEVGKDLRAKVRVLDVHDEPLLASFFPLMGLKVLPSSSIISVRPDTELANDKFTAYYIVHGAQVGHTSLKAQSQPHSGITVTSAVKHVEVFPPLELIPKNITLIIGSLFQVLSRGGPRPQCTVVFSIGDSHIAGVSSSGLLDAQELGNTRVVGQAVGQNMDTGETVVYSEDYAYVNVISLGGIRIHSPLSRLETGTQMPMFAIGLTEHETPFTFGSAVPPLTFVWSINNKDVVKMQNVFHKSGIEVQDESNFATQLVAMEPGQVTVRLEVTAQKGSKVQVLNNALLYDELQIQVFEKLAVINPSVCDGKILMTPNTEAVVKTNRDGSARMTYQILSSDNNGPAVVNVSDSGLLTTGSVSGQAALHITAQEDFGTSQTVVLFVKIKPVSYLMINSDTTLKTAGGILKTIPVGVTLHFTVSYHDNIGEQFYATNVQMRFRCSRYDLVHVEYGTENNTLVMKATKVGQTILKVWDYHNPLLSDYINVPVDYAITPAKISVPLGKVICFDTPIVYDKGYAGLWYTDDRNLIINKKSGIATATKIGTSFVIYNVSSDISTYTEVVVNPIQRLTLDSNVDFLTNVHGKTKGLTVSVSLTEESDVIGKNCISRVSEELYRPDRIPFHCHLEMNPAISEMDVSELFHVIPEFDSKTGKFGCQISLSQENTATQQMSTLETTITLSVMVLAQEGQPEVRATPQNFQFLPAFYVHNTEIHLSNLHPLSSVRVSTIPILFDQIGAVVSDSTILEALTPEVDGHSGHVSLYPIRLLDTAAVWEREKLDVFVELICKKTGHVVKLPVFIRLIGQKPDYIDSYRGRYVGWGALIRNIWNNYQSWLFILFIIIVTAIAVVIGYHAILGPKYRAAANTSGVFLTPGGAATATPYPNYAPGMSPPTFTQTPNMPQLFSPGYSPVDGRSPVRRRSPYH